MDKPRLFEGCRSFRNSMLERKVHQTFVKKTYNAFSKISTTVGHAIQIK